MRELSMPKFGMLSVLLFILATTCLQSEDHVGQLNQNADHGAWVEENFNIALYKEWSLMFHFEERCGDDWRRFWYYEQWATLQYDFSKQIKKSLCLSEDSLFKSFTMGPGFAQAWSLQANTKGVVHWAQANRPDIQAFLTLGWKGWTLRQRLILEYWGFTTKHYKSFGYCRYRNFLLSPWKFTCLKINPFLADEIFLRETTSWHSGVFYENRFRTGIVAELFRECSALLWWQIRSVKQLSGHPSWFNTYQFGLNFDFNF